MSYRPAVRLLARLLPLMLLLAACGASATSSSAGSSNRSSDPATPGEASTTASEVAFPVAVTAANGEVTIEERPDSIISLSPTATEMLFAIGAGDQVEAVDEFSTYPPEAPTTDLSGFEPNIEAIAGHDPDLVVLADDGADLSGSLAELDIPAIVAPAAETLDDTYEQMEQLGTATGHGAEAAAVVEQMQSDIDKITADVPDLDEPLSYYHELDDTYYTVTSDTFIGQIYDLVGLRNIADAVEDDAGGYPQLSEEFIIDADPDLIFLADTKCCGQTAGTVAERPGWGQLTAVRNDAVIELDDDVASRWGPRVVDLLQTVADAVDEHSGDGGA